MPKRFKVKTPTLTVSSLLVVPDAASHLLVLGHGAGAGMEHRHMNAIADALFEVNVATFRYQFPYMEEGKSRTNSKDVCVAVIDCVVERAAKALPDVPLLIGGHSFGGRMSTHAVVELDRPDIRGLVCFSFPLHAPGRHEDKRATHLREVQVPTLFLSGTRDTMMSEDLMTALVGDMPDGRIHWLHTADHGYKILKRTRDPAEDVYTEAARILREWLGGPGFA